MPTTLQSSSGFLGETPNDGLRGWAHRRARRRDAAEGDGSSAEIRICRAFSVRPGGRLKRWRTAAVRPPGLEGRRLSRKRKPQDVFDLLKSQHDRIREASIEIFQQRAIHEGLHGF